MSEPEDLFYDMWHTPPNKEPANLYVARMCQEHGITYERWEGQPIADQIKLHRCRNIPDPLPKGFRRSLLW